MYVFKLNCTERSQLLLLGNFVLGMDTLGGKGQRPRG